MSKVRVEPFVWLLFSAGGVAAATVLPVLAFLFGLAIPLGWVDRPDHDHLAGLLATPVAFLALLPAFVVMLVHAAHRFRFTLYDGLQIKLRRTTAWFCYGAAALGSIATVAVMIAVATR